MRSPRTKKGRTEPEDYLLESYFLDLSFFANLTLFSLGTMLVVWGATKFESGAIFIAKAANIPKVVVGATIVSLATTFPEFLTSFIAASSGKTLMSVGNALGSYLFNIGLIVGLAAMIKSYPIPKENFQFQGLCALAAAIAMAIATLGQEIGKTIGIIFTLALCAFLFLSWKQSSTKKEFDKSPPKISPKDWLSPILWFIAGAGCVSVGCILLVENGAQIARYTGVSELIIGLTIVAVGTSLPEIVLAITSIIRGNVDLSLGNILGANVLDIFWVIGLSALANPLPIVTQTRVLDVPFSILIVSLLLVFGLRGNHLSKAQGSALVGTYLLYLILIGIFFL